MATSPQSRDGQDISSSADVELQDDGSTDVELQDVNSTDVELQDVGSTDVELRDVGSTDVELQDVRSTDVELQDVGASVAMAKPLLEHSSARPKGWPTLPNNVKYSVLSVVTDVGLTLLFCYWLPQFLAFALTVQHYDQAPVWKHRETTRMLQDATRYGPTVFPILFACVLGRASHSILVWRLERGERIGVLDILAGSTSLTSTVTSQLKLRMISIFGLGLVAIWALSPIGGQACLRQMSQGHNITTDTASFTYMVQKKYLEEAFVYLSLGPTNFHRELRMGTYATKYVIDQRGMHLTGTYAGI